MSGIPHSRSRVAAAVLAVVAPALILLSAAAWYTREEPHQIARSALKLEARLDGDDPDVVFIGNSLGQMAIDIPRLAPLLGERGLAVYTMELKSTFAPSWYAILKNRVFARGYRPRLVVLPTTLPWLMGTEPWPETGWSTLADQMTPDDSVILEKTHGSWGGPPVLNRALRRRAEVKRQLLHGLRDAVVGGLWVRSGQGGAASGHDLAEQALARVFGSGAIEKSERTRVVPIVEVRRSRPQRTVSGPKDSYLPDLAALCAAHSARLVVVRLPLPPSNAQLGEIDGRTTRATLRLMNETGVSYIDLSRMGLPEGSFMDDRHTNRIGQRRVTQALGEAIVRQGLLRDGPVDPIPIPSFATRVERVGSPPEIPPPTLVPAGGCTWKATTAPAAAHLHRAAAELEVPVPLTLRAPGMTLARVASPDDVGPRCTGTYVERPAGLLFAPSRRPARGATPRVVAALSDEVPLVSPDGVETWWLYPGTFLVFHMLASGHDPIPLTVEAAAVGAAARAAPPTLRARDEIVPFTGTSKGTLVAALELPNALAPWRFAVEAPADGPYYVLRTVVVGRRDGRSFLVGGPRSYLQRRRGREPTGSP